MELNIWPIEIEDNRQTSRKWGTVFFLFIYKYGVGRYHIRISTCTYHMKSLSPNHGCSGRPSNTPSPVE